MGEKIADVMQEITDGILRDFEKERAIDKMEVFSQPDREVVIGLIRKLHRIVFPGYFIDRTYKIYNVSTMVMALTEDVAFNLNRQVALALRFDPALADKSDAELAELAEDKTVQFMRAIPGIREYLDTDVEALFQGDPAAESKDAIIMSYPGIYAISVQRFAHVLYQLHVPIIPRILTEHAHSKTGIDINPGATIGKYFFIDHGTGIVVGETTEIGEHVKLYQGVTLGALSTRGGRVLVSKKRHPTIEDNVTIYSGASILGGDTVIGENAVIGGNVFITHSVPANAKVYIKNQEQEYSGDFFGPDDYVI